MLDAMNSKASWLWALFTTQPILMSISLFFPHSVGFRWPYWRKRGFRAPWPYWIARPNGTQWCPSSKQIVVIVEKTWHDFGIQCISSCQFDFFWINGRIQYSYPFTFTLLHVFRVRKVNLGKKEIKQSWYVPHFLAADCTLEGFMGFH